MEQVKAFLKFIFGVIIVILVGCTIAIIPNLTKADLTKDDAKIIDYKEKLMKEEIEKYLQRQQKIAVEERKKNIYEMTMVIAQVVWCEDNRSLEGALKVLSVAYNRAQEKLIEHVFTEITKPYQFECYQLIRDGKFKVKQDKLYKQIVDHINLIVNGKFKPTIKATHYLNPKKVEKLPKWVRVYKRVEQYDQHAFYYNKKYYYD